MHRFLDTVTEGPSGPPVDHSYRCQLRRDRWRESVRQKGREAETDRWVDNERCPGASRRYRGEEPRGDCHDDESDFRGHEGWLDGFQHQRANRQTDHGNHRPHKLVTVRHSTHQFCSRWLAPLISPGCARTVRPETRRSPGLIVSHIAVRGIRQQPHDWDDHGGVSIRPRFGDDAPLPLGNVSRSAVLEPPYNWAQASR